MATTLDAAVEGRSGSVGWLTPTRATALFVGALLVALVVAFLARDTLGFVLARGDGGYDGDIEQYIMWTHLVTTGGLQAAYQGTWPDSYAVYPPVTLYSYALVGLAYERLVDPSFNLTAALSSAWMLHAIKLVALAWDLLAALAIYLLVRAKHGAVWAGIAGAVYVANPATLLDVAHWGQPDGAHSLFTALGVGFIGLGMAAPAWGSMAFAALAKPQAWALLPLLLLASVRSNTPRKLLAGLAVGGVAALLIISPWLLTGRITELLSLPGTISTVMPAVSADAHNFWWLVLERRHLDPLFVDDSMRFVGPLTYRMAAALLVLGQFALSYWLFWTRRAGLAEAAALGALGWFVFTTQAHENHLFFAIPLLALALPERPKLWLPLLVVSVTVLLNMSLQDDLLLQALGTDPGDRLIQWLRDANALANVLMFVGWGAWAVLREPLRLPAWLPFGIIRGSAEVAQR